METIWLGSQATFSDYQDRQARLDAALSTGMYAGSAIATPEAFSQHGNVVVLDIKGPLVNGESLLNDLFGMTSYTRIRNNLIEAATDPGVGAIVLNIDSAGGIPNGLPDVSQLVRQISAIKPVAAFSGGSMCSAAYWLGSAAPMVFAGPTATVGSIGVITTMLDRTEQFKREGIEPVVLRAGSKKALANPLEPVTEEVKVEVQGQLDQLYGVFVDHVAEYRGVSTAQVLSSMADGQEFIGESAVTAGLIDGITTLDALVGSLQTRIESQRGKETMAKKQLLTERQVALLQEGVDIRAALEGSAAVETPAVTEELPPVETRAEVAAEPITTELSTQITGNSELVTFLQAELNAKSAEVTQLSVRLADIEKEINGYKAHHHGLKAIVATRVNNMQIGLGGKALFSADLPADVLLAQHSQLEAAFNKQFPVGGVSKTTVEEPTNTLKADPMATARLRAVQTHK